MDLSVRELKSVDDILVCEMLQERAWAMPNPREVVPLHLLVTVAKNGGVMLGAFDGDRPIGFVFGFLGRGDDGRLKHCSHMMGVLPEYQSSGVGAMLKLAQRDAVLAQGLDLITWTYDPLASRNAYLNLRKLGAESRTYLRELYGQMTDGLNRGLPTDRFQVDWWLSSDHVLRRIAGESPAGEGALLVNDTIPTAAGVRAPGAVRWSADAAVLRVEVPADYQAVKAADLDLALEWRLAVRDIMETYFQAGYTAVDYISQMAGDERRNYYLLSRADPSLTAQ